MEHYPFSKSNKIDKLLWFLFYHPLPLHMNKWYVKIKLAYLLKKYPIEELLIRKFKPTLSFFVHNCIENEFRKYSDIMNMIPLEWYDDYPLLCESLLSNRYISERLRDHLYNVVIKQELMYVCIS